MIGQHQRRREKLDLRFSTRHSEIIRLESLCLEAEGALEWQGNEHQQGKEAWWNILEH